MTDNGAAMQAEEFRCGLHTLSILHETTLPYSPYQYVAPADMCCCGCSHAEGMIAEPLNST
jgi:hypothetical protein